MTDSIAFRSDFLTLQDSVFSYQDGFYPGQILRGPACAFKNASWLSGTQPILSSRAYFKVTVEEVGQLAG